MMIDPAHPVLFYISITALAIGLLVSFLLELRRKKNE